MLEDALQTHVLDSYEKDCKGLHVEFLKFEALKALNNSWTRWQFVQDIERPYAHLADPRVAQLWQLYDAQAPSFKWEHPYAEMFDRKGFLQHSIYVATSEENVASGLWVSDVSVKKRTRSARIHVITSQAFAGKGIATELLQWFERDARGKYEAITCSWGPRSTRPGIFFAKQGYLVMDRKNCGYATKTL